MQVRIEHSHFALDALLNCSAFLKGPAKKVLAHFQINRSQLLLKIEENEGRETFWQR